MIFYLSRLGQHIRIVRFCLKYTKFNKIRRRGIIMNINRRKAMKTIGVLGVTGALINGKAYGQTQKATAFALIGLKYYTAYHLAVKNPSSPHQPRGATAGRGPCPPHVSRASRPHYCGTWKCRVGSQPTFYLSGFASLASSAPN